MKYLIYMRRSISSISLTDRENNSITNFMIPSSASFKRAADQDAAGSFEKIEVTGRAKVDQRDILRNCRYCNRVVVIFDQSETFSFGSADYPATLILEETEGRTSFKITYERPL